MTMEEAKRLMREAWSTRRASFDADPEEAQRLMATAERDLLRAVELCRGHRDPVLLAQALHLLAHVRLDLGRTEHAEPLWQEAVTLLRGAGDPLQLAHKVRHLGDLHARLGRAEQAGECFCEAIELYRRHDPGDSLDLANATRRLADFEARFGDPVRARELWQETRDRYAALGLSEGVIEAETRSALLLSQDAQEPSPESGEADADGDKPRR